MCIDNFHYLSMETARREQQWEEIIMMSEDSRISSFVNVLWISIQSLLRLLWEEIETSTWFYLNNVPVPISPQKYINCYVLSYYNN